MAGFEKYKAYYIPRTVQSLPWMDEQLCSALFPDICEWRRVINSPEGDHYGKSLVDELLPFFARVACQDGIYWVHKYPENRASLLLLQRLRNPTYETWARNQRSTCADLATNFSENQSEVLGKAVCQSYNMLVRRQDRYNTNVVRRVETLEEKLQASMRDQRDSLHMQFEQKKLIQNLLTRNNQLLAYINSLGTTTNFSEPGTTTNFSEPTEGKFVC